MGHFNHTAETDAIIRAGYAEHRPVVHIANDLGVSKNVVIGRARRIGLSSQGNLTFALENRDLSEQARRSIGLKKKAWWAENPDQKAPAVRRMLEGRKAKRASQ